MAYCVRAAVERKLSLSIMLYLWNPAVLIEISSKVADLFHDSAFRHELEHFPLPPRRQASRWRIGHESASAAKVPERTFRN